MKEIVKLRDGRTASPLVTGSGIPAFLIPGDPETGAAHMADTARLFPSVLRCYLAGPGASAGGFPSDRARYLEAVRAALGLSQVVVLGHGTGAAVALAWTASYPQSVRACIAVTPRGTGDPRAAALLPRIRRPTLVVTGESDVTDGLAQAELVASEVPGAQLTVLPGCGQDPAVEAPEAHRTVVLDFLRSTY